MKIGCFQFKPELNDFEINYNKIINTSEKCDLDLIIFPELSTSGYLFKDKKESFNAGQSYLSSNLFNSLTEISKSKNLIIVYGFPEISNNKVFNSAQIIFPDDKYNRIYRKTHLFYNEINYFDFGDTGFFNIYYPPFDINIGTMICYDWRFPEAARTLALLSSDIIVCPSNLVTPLWPKVIPARAIENKVYFAISNRIGKERVGNEELTFNGKSTIYDYEGNILITSDYNDEKLISANINPNLTRNKSFNQYNNIFNDRRENYYFK